MEESTAPFLVLLPIAFNDGSPVPNEIFDRLLLEVTVKFGGGSFLDPRIGGWIDPEGRYQPEAHRPLLIVTSKGRQGELEDWVKHAGKELDQQAMLLLTDFCEAHFIEVETW